ncbi:MAG: hypothetical protein J0M02_04970 [Planctomycetes bacterium]|nr:hypothetical protein [Planctomycetota bacterium]
MIHQTGMRQAHHPIRAFTLIEIIASVLLFVMGTMAIVGVIILGLGTARRAQSDATAWATAMSVLKDPMPMGVVSDRGTGTLAPWTWSQSGNAWSASDGSSDPVWKYTAWQIGQDSDVLVADMRNPIANNPAVFPGGAPIAGCARGFLNGYYVERREQSRASDRIGALVRIVEVRVDVYWANFAPGSDGRPLASLVDRVVRQGTP